MVKDSVRNKTKKNVNEPDFVSIFAKNKSLKKIYPKVSFKNILSVSNVISFLKE